MKRPIILTFTIVAACSSHTADPDPNPADGGAMERDAGAAERDAGEARDGGPAIPCDAAGPVVVTFDTEDGETLEADLYTTGQTNAPVAVLLHMIPPGNDRSNYPAAFITELTQRGINVLNVDRRGAGGSTGTARDAFQGPDGKLDPKGAVDFLAAHDCGFDLARLAIVGASNGTTSAVDYTVHADSTDGWTSPKALVFLTGGAYTEAQNRIANTRAAFDPLPIQFVYSTAERGWSVGYEPNKAAGWRFDEYTNGAHGTRMFDEVAQSMTDVAAFLEGAL
ncbi:MAG: hypothetical protein RMA76_24015 [Deltaproteobacteria bacterium]|jgi:pimeloyl-ACP methyl ester carboxylesterase